MSVQIVPMQPNHLDGVQAVQHSVYAPALWESTMALAQKQQLSPNTCFIVQNAVGEVVAYVFSHPWRRQAIPKLNAELPSLPDNSELLYIHDLAVHPAWHGQRIAQQLMAEVQFAAQRLFLSDMALVAVQGAQSFWQRLAFVVDTESIAILSENLQVYGADALYMVRSSQ